MFVHYVSLLFPLQPKKYYWNVTREWPPVHSCYLSHSLLAVTYQGPSTSSSGTDGGSSANPKGVFLLTNDFIPVKVSSEASLNCHHTVCVCRLLPSTGSWRSVSWRLVQLLVLHWVIVLHWLHWQRNRSGLTLRKPASFEGGCGSYQ